MATTILNHPLIDHKLTIMRNKDTGTKEFRQNLDEIAMLMAYEVTKGLPTKNIEVVTPICQMTGKELVRPIILVPILRAGLGLVDGFKTIIPTAKVGHIGMARNESTLEPEEYYAKFPACLVAAPEGIAVIERDHPDVDLVVAALDEKLNEKGYIVPGLGDAGDRLFGTDE